MKRILWIVFLAVLILPAYKQALNSNLAYAQTSGGASGGGGFEKTCPANGGAVSIQVLAKELGRQGFCLMNYSGLDVRVGINVTGLPNLTAANSFVLKAGVNTCDSAPGGYYGKVVCMSDSNAAAVIGVYRTLRPN